MLPILKALKIEEAIPPKSTGKMVGKKNHPAISSLKEPTCIGLSSVTLKPFWGL